MTVDEDKADKVHAINATGTQNIADVCKKLDCKMTYISTDYVFNGKGTTPWKPDCKDYAPLNVYRKTIIYGMQFIFFAAAVIFQKLLGLGSLDFGMIILVFILMTFAPVLIDVITVWLKGIYAKSLDQENPGKFTVFIDKLRK